MDAKSIIGVLAGLIAGTSALAFVYFYLTSRSKSMGSILGTSNISSLRVSGAHARDRVTEELSSRDFEKLKKETKKKMRKKPVPTLEEQFFHAGMFSDKEKRDFMRLRLIAPLVAGPAAGGAVLYLNLGADLTLGAFVFGVLLGLQIPKSIIQRRIAARADEILYYLPLVIEQIVIGVSSSLDIGPCLQRVVSMADERDSHNVVTELVKISQFYIKAGSSLEHALTEVGKVSGNTECKHAFMALAQVARHGGEITRQLQELADSVSTQRETKIEAKIKKLELEATGPVAMVFAGFLIILLIGFGLKLLTAF